MAGSGAITADARARSDASADAAHRTALDGIRALAIAGVMLVHAGAPGARSGWVGVDLFFVLSGFLVGGMMLEDAARPEGLRLGRFFSRRW